MKKKITKPELDPRQTAFLAAYLDPESPTFSNAYQSALRPDVGYSETTAKLILGAMPKWLQESLDHGQMLKKAEKNINLLLENEDSKILLETSKFVASRIGRDKWSEKLINDNQGQKIEVVITDYKSSPKVHI